MLTLANVAAGYDAGDVIQNISFEIRAGENLAIIGPNGCGKTTLLKVISNLLPFKGDIILGGKNFARLKRREISAKIALLSQQIGIYFAYSVYDTVMMGRYLHIKDRFSNSPSRRDEEAVLAALAAVNLLDERARDITKLSGGQLQRVFLARTLAQEPQIILLDEPTNHLDLKCQMEILDYLKEWAKNGERAVVGVLHDLNLAMQLSENILVMKDGEIKAIDKAAQILSGGLLDNVYEMDVAGYMRRSLQKWVPTEVGRSPM